MIETVTATFKSLTSVLGIVLEIVRDDLTGRKIIELINEHFEQMVRDSPPGSCHALGVEELRKKDVTFWSAWEGDQLLGCGALKELNSLHGEVKSMRTVERYRGRGVASKLLDQILGEAKRRNYASLSLETGSMASYAPARSLYQKFGFRECPPFGEYVEDSNSTFMTKELL